MVELLLLLLLLLFTYEWADEGGEQDMPGEEENEDVDAVEEGDE